MTVVVGVLIQVGFVGRVFIEPDLGLRILASRCDRWRMRWQAKVREDPVQDLGRSDHGHHHHLRPAQITGLGVESEGSFDQYRPGGSRATECRQRRFGHRGDGVGGFVGQVELELLVVRGDAGVRADCLGNGVLRFWRQGQPRAVFGAAGERAKIWFIRILIGRTSAYTPVNLAPTS